MSGTEKRKVKIVAADKASKGDIPGSVAPNALAMGGGKDGATRTNADIQALPVRSKTETDEQFPTAALADSDPRDAMMEAKLSSQKDPSKPGLTPFGQLIAHDSDFEWLQSKRDKEAEANFQQWFATNFDKMSPEQKAMAREIWPEFYRQRVELLDKQINLQRRLAHLKVTGIKTKEDLLLQYAAEAGFIDVDPLKNILTPEASQASARRQENFTRGLFNPNRLPRGDKGGNTRPQNSLAAMNRAASSSAASAGVGDAAFSALGIVPADKDQNFNFANQLASVEL